MDLVTNGMEFIISISPVASVPPSRRRAASDKDETQARRRDHKEHGIEGSDRVEKSRGSYVLSLLVPRFSVLVYISLTGAPLWSPSPGFPPATCTTSNKSQQ